MEEVGGGEGGRGGRRSENNARTSSKIIAKSKGGKKKKSLKTSEPTTVQDNARCQTSARIIKLAFSHTRPWQRRLLHPCLRRPHLSPASIKLSAVLITTLLAKQERNSAGWRNRNGGTQQHNEVINCGRWGEGGRE